MLKENENVEASLTPRSESRGGQLGSIPCTGAQTFEERQLLYQQYALTYHERFRAAIDYQFAEEPRQIIGMIVLLAGLSSLGFVTDYLGASSVTTPSKNSADFIIDDYATVSGIRVGLAGSIFALLVYCFLQTRDGLLVRPHPGLWRCFHAIGLAHLICFSILLTLPVSTGRQLIRLLLPGVNRNLDVFAGTLDLQCSFSLRTLKIQMSKLWFTSHIIGWFAKMVIFRDWNFCLVLSIAFECIELSFQWLIPELKECWWDSVILDVLLSNTLGMIIGFLVLRLFNSLRYDWIGLRLLNGSKNATSGNLSPSLSLSTLSPSPLGLLTLQETGSRARQLITRFLPFTWSKYHWSFFETPERLAQASILLGLALLTELNLFLTIYALDIPANHIYHKLRVTHLCFLAVSGVAETYNYVCQGSMKPKMRRRIGHNAWLFVAILLVEFLVAVRYGRDRFAGLIPDVQVLFPWGLSLTFFCTWCYFHFYVIGPERLRVSRGVWRRLHSNSHAVPVSPNNKVPPMRMDNRVRVESIGDPGGYSEGGPWPETTPVTHLSDQSKARLTAAPSPNTILSSSAPQLCETESAPPTQRDSLLENGSLLRLRRPASISVPPSSDAEEPTAFSIATSSATEKSKQQKLCQDSAVAPGAHSAANQFFGVFRSLIDDRRSRAGVQLYRIGLIIVTLPPWICFAPLLSLVRFYDFAWRTGLTSIE